MEVIGNDGSELKKCLKWYKIGTEAQRTSLKNAKKKDYKTLFYIHQSVDSNNFEKNLKITRCKEPWDISVKL